MRSSFSTESPIIEYNKITNHLVFVVTATSLAFLGMAINNFIEEVEWKKNRAFLGFTALAGFIALFGAISAGCEVKYDDDQTRLRNCFEASSKILTYSVAAYPMVIVFAFAYLCGLPTYLISCCKNQPADDLCRNLVKPSPEEQSLSKTWFNRFFCCLTTKQQAEEYASPFV